MASKGLAGALAVAGVLVVLGVVLPSIDHSVDGGFVALPAGAIVQVGALDGDQRRPVAFQVPAGWALDSGESSLSESVALVSGATSFQLNVVMVEGATPRQLWDGLQRIQEVGGHPPVAGTPVPVVTRQGVQGLAGPITFRDRAGTMAVFAAPTLGADVVVSGPPEEVLVRGEEIGNMLESVTFAGLTS
ncbi:hypothetical protein [Acrocarpospora catenulata]|uniref:hypothetical protein n=1 Tax=Acrocarpospora catenulata TaxID=2836182 RepID=UPI001BD98446|nr:hypothetical protein [Acrocarpospora catenulata]